MRHLRARRLVRTAVAVAALACTSRIASAQLRWDPMLTPTTPSGGSGTWNLSALNWSNGTSDVAWDGGVAVFDAAGGAVSLGDPISAAGLTFNVGGYTLSSSNATNGLTLASGALLTQSASVTGINTIAAPVSLNNATVNVNGGTLLFTNTSAAAPNSITSSTFNVGAGATLGFNAISGANPLGSGTISLNGGTLAITPTSSGTAGAFNSRFGTGNVSINLGLTDFNDTVISGSPTVMSGQTNVSPTPAAGINFNPTYPPAPPPPFFAGGPATQFSARFMGAINVTSAGDYTFQLISDDAARVYIDNQLVVLDNGGHIQATVNGSPITLSAGLHDFRVDYAQAGGASRLTWNYSGPDTGNSMVLVPAAAMQTYDAVTMGNNVTITQDSTLNLFGVNFTQLGMGTLTFAPASGANAALTITGGAGRSLHFSGTTLAGGNNVIDTAADVYTGNLNAIPASPTPALVKRGSGRLILDYIDAQNNLNSSNIIDIQQGRVVLIGGSPGAAGPQTTFDPAGSATLQLNGGTLTLDTRYLDAAFHHSVIATPAGGLVEDAAAGTTMTLGGGNSNVTITLNGDMRASTLAVNNTPGNLAGTNAPGSTLSLFGPITGTGKVIKIPSPSAGVGQDAGSTVDLGTLIFNGSSPAWQGKVVGQSGSGTIEGVFVNASDQPFGPNPLTLQNEKLVLAGQTSNLTYSAGNDLNVSSDLTIDLEHTQSATSMTYQMGALNVSGKHTITQIGNFGSVSTFSSASLGGDTTLNINFNSMTLGPVSETTPSMLIKDGMNTLILNSANSYTRGTTVANGTLKLGTAAALPAAPLVVTGGILDLNGTSPVVSTLSSNVDLAHGAGVMTNNNSSALASLTVTGSSSFAGNINRGVGQLALNLAPGASLSLTSASTFGGGTTIGKSANLAVTEPLVGNVLGAGSVTLAGGTLALQGQRQILSAGQQPGLAAQFYDSAPAKITATLVNPNFVSLGAMNNHLSTLSPTVSVQTTTNGKDNFDFSNQNDAIQAPFGTAASVTADTTADYGFKSAANYEVKFTGYINVPQAGTATFSTSSDDGSAIWIDDGFTPVVSNNFFQNVTTRSGSFNFTTPGLHAITIGYYQGGGNEGFKVSWTPPGGAAHTLLNNEVVTANLGYAAAQSYANDVAVTADSAIDVRNSLAATLGNLSIGANKLSVSSSDSTSSPYSLSFGSLSASTAGDTTLDVQNSAGGGLGMLTLGPIHGIVGNNLHKIGPGALAVTGTSDYPGVLFAEGGRINVTSGAILSNDTQVKAGAILGGLGTINGTVSIFSQGKLAPSFDGTETLGAFHAKSAQFASEPALFDVALRTPHGAAGGQYDSLIYASSVAGNAELRINDDGYAGPSQPGGFFWIIDGQFGSVPTVGNLDVLWQGTLLHDGDTFSDSNGFTYQINYDAAGDPQGTGHDVLLTVVATPEPTAASLLMIGALGLLGRRRSRGDRRSDN